MSDIGLFLDKVYEAYHHPRFISSDPLELVYNYENGRNREIAAFICAIFAYGQVKQIKSFLKRFLALLGSEPYQFLLDFRPTDNIDTAKLYYRFQTSRDILLLITTLSYILKEYGSLDEAFIRNGEAPLKHKLSMFARFFRETGCKLAEKHGINNSKYFNFLVTDPDDGSGCKRMNLFLRWVVRSDAVDLGLWKSLSPADLIIPLDVHIARITRALGLTKRKNSGWLMAEEISENLREICPHDPIKYDFSLSRLGIMKLCPPNPNPSYCSPCDLNGICSMCLRDGK